MCVYVTGQIYFQVNFFNLFLNLDCFLNFVQTSLFLNLNNFRNPFYTKFNFIHLV